MKEKFDKNVEEKIKELVVARIQARMSQNLKLSIGFDGSVNKGEMIEHVKKGDEIGRQIIQTHLNFMKAQATGQLTTALNSV